MSNILWKGSCSLNLYRVYVDVHTVHRDILQVCFNTVQLNVLFNLVKNLSQVFSFIKCVKYILLEVTFNKPKLIFPQMHSNLEEMVHECFWLMFCLNKSLH